MTWRFLTAVIKQGYWPALKNLKTGHHALHVWRKRGPGVSNFSRVTLFKFRSSFQFCQMAGTTRCILSIPEGLEQSIPQPEGNLSMLGSCENSREICARKERRVSGAGHFLFDQPMRSLHPPVFQISSMFFFLTCFRVRNCAYLAANATKNLVLVTRISQLVASQRLIKLDFIVDFNVRRN